jgi:glycosyltransferase involved in cell wall biosynthesis
MKVSIIIPVYNVEEYLQECLNSAVNQTLEDIEIICINDGSTDSSLEILNKYKDRCFNIKIINQENKGLSATRNVGIRNAKGKYIYFLDSDDYIDLDSMRICYEESEKFSLDILTFDAECFYDKDYIGIEMNENYSRLNLLDENVMNGKEFYIQSNKKKCYKAPVWLNFYKTEFIRTTELFFTEGILHEDEIHTCQALLAANRVKYISNKFFKRRFRNDSIMTSKPNIKRVDGNFMVVKKLYEIYIEYKESKNIDLLNILKESINTFIRRSLWHCDNLQNYDKRNEIIKLVLKMDKIIEIRTDIYVHKVELYYNA